MKYWEIPEPSLEPPEPVEHFDPWEHDWEDDDDDFED